MQEQDLIGPSVPSHEPIIVGRQIELLAAIKNGLRNISSSRTIFPRETNPRIVPKNHNSLSKYKDSYSDTGDETGDTTSSDGDYTDYTEYGGDYTDYTEYGGEYTEYGGDYTYSDSSETESNSTYNTDFPLTYTFVENTVDYFYTSIPDDRFTEFATTTEEVKKLRDGMDFIDLFIDEIGLPPEVLRILVRCSVWNINLYFNSANVDIDKLNIHT